MVFSNTEPVRLSDVLDVEALSRCIDQRLVRVDSHPGDDLSLLNYTSRTQYQQAWSHETLTCRGLVVRGDVQDPDAQVVARPFRKFANASEHHDTSAFGALPVGREFEVYEKLDGSLGILYPHKDGWAVCTRGSFQSRQAQAATVLWNERYSDVAVPEGVTLLFEYISPWNRIVVDYGQMEDLVLLAAIDIRTGADVELPEYPGPIVKRFGVHEMTTQEITTREITAGETGVRFDALREEVAGSQQGDLEGYVVRFMPTQVGQPSLRVKLKLPEYMRVHRLVTGVSTTTIWDHLVNERDLGELLEAVPDEFYDFVQTTVSKLREEHQALVSGARVIADELSHLERRDAAAKILAQQSVPPALVFQAMDGKDIEASAWKLVKPEHATPSVDGTALDDTALDGPELAGTEVDGPELESPEVDRVA